MFALLKMICYVMGRFPNIQGTPPLLRALLGMGRCRDGMFCFLETPSQLKWQTSSSYVRFPPALIACDFTASTRQVALADSKVSSLPFARKPLGMQRAKSAKRGWKCRIWWLLNGRMHLYMNVGFPTFKYLRSMYDIHKTESWTNPRHP